MPPNRMSERMPRIARVVAAGLPHHVTQRGNRKQRTFFSDRDYRRYLRLMTESCQHWGVEVWAYCLMPNHVHLIAVPKEATALSRAIGDAHRSYTCSVNLREGWRGHLWQGRFASCVLDDNHLLAAVRYVELNPVRASLVKLPEAWPYSSARAHLDGRPDPLVTPSFVNEMVSDWRSYLSTPVGDGLADTLKRHERTGRPLGSAEFVATLERSLGRVLHPRRPGRKSTTK